MKHKEVLRNRNRTRPRLHQKLEEILGFTLRGNTLSISPSIPSEWQEYHIRYKYKSTTYLIQIKNPDQISGKQTLGEISLLDDSQEHTVEFTLNRNK